MLLGNYPIEQQSQDGNRQQSKPKRPSFHMAKTWNLTLRYPCSSLFPTKQQLRRIFAFKRVLFWPSWSSAKKESRLLCIHWVFFAAWLLNYWSGRQSGSIPWTWCQKGDKYRWNQMESNGSIIYIQLWEILRPLTGVVSMLWSWIGLLNLIELIGFLYAVECAHSFEYIAIHSHNLPYLCILRIKMYKA